MTIRGEFFLSRATGAANGTSSTASSSNTSGGCGGSSGNGGGTVWTGLLFRLLTPTGSTTAHSSGGLEIRVNSLVPIPPELIGCPIQLFGSMCAFDQYQLFEAVAYERLEDMGQVPLQRQPALLPAPLPVQPLKKASRKAKLDLENVVVRVVRLSPVLAYRRAGLAFFLELELQQAPATPSSSSSTSAFTSTTDESSIPPGSVISVLLTNQAVFLRPYLQPNDTFRVARLKHCLFEPSSLSTASTPTPSSTGTSETKQHLYLLDEYYPGVFASLTSSTDSSSSPRLLLDLDQPLPLDWVQPSHSRLSALEQAKMRYTELDIIATVEAFHPSSGWIALQDAVTAPFNASSSSSSSSSKAASTPGSQSVRGSSNVDVQATPYDPMGHSIPLHLLLTHRPPYDPTYPSLRAGTVLRADAVLPVYLWGTLRGFAVTSRTHLQIIEYANPVGAGLGSLQGDGGTQQSQSSIGCSLGPTLGSSSSSGSGTHSSNGKANSLSSRAAALRACRSHLLLSWRITATENVERALAAQIYTSSSSMSSSISISSSSSSGKRSKDKHERQRRVTAALTCIENYNSTRLSLTAATTLPRPYCLQEEFSDGFVPELYSIRAGLDADQVDAALPKVWSPSRLREFAERLIEERHESLIRSGDLALSLVDVTGIAVYLTHCYSGFGAEDNKKRPRDGGLLSNVSFDVEIVGRLISALLLPTLAEGASNYISYSSGKVRTALSLMAWLEMADSKGRRVQCLVSGTQSDSLWAALLPFLAENKKGNAQGGIRSNNSSAAATKPSTFAFANARNTSNANENRLRSLLPAADLLVVVRNPCLLLEESPHANYEAVKMLVLSTAANVRLCAGQGGLDAGNKEPAHENAVDENESRGDVNSQDATSDASHHLQPSLQATGIGTGKRSKRGFVEAQAAPAQSFQTQSQVVAALERRLSSPKDILEAIANSFAQEAPEASAIANTNTVASVNLVSSHVAAQASKSTSTSTSTVDPAWAQPASSVRHALSIPGASSTARLPIQDLVGIIYDKGLQAMFKGDNLGGSARTRPVKQQVKIVLRDVCFADSINVYVPLAAAESMVVGMVVSMKKVVLALSAELKPHIRFEADSTVGLLAVPSASKIGAICSRMAAGFGLGGRASSDLNGSGQRSSVGNSDISGALSPPRTSLAHLCTTQLYNRCSWTLLARMVYVKRVEVRLQCSACKGNNFAEKSSLTSVVTTSRGAAHLYNGYNPASDISANSANVNPAAGWACKQCSASRFLRPTWSATVVIEDGTSEALVYIDGVTSVLEMLQPAREVSRSHSSFQFAHGSSDHNSTNALFAHNSSQSAAPRLDPSEIKEICEDACYDYGCVLYDHEDARARRQAIYQKEAQRIAAEKERLKETEARMNHQEVHVHAAQPSSLGAAGPNPFGNSGGDKTSRIIAERKRAQQAAQPREDNTNQFTSLEHEEGVSQAPPRAAASSKRSGAGAPAELALDSYVSLCDYYSPLELECRLIFKKDRKLDAVKTFQRKIKLQTLPGQMTDKEGRTKDVRHYNAMADVNTLSTDNLCLKGFTVRMLRDRRDVRAEAWRQLTQLQQGKGVV